MGRAAAPQGWQTARGESAANHRKTLLWQRDGYGNSECKDMGSFGLLAERTLDLRDSRLPRPPEPFLSSAS